ncbi:hypothetical protein JCM8097_006519 [Rhodosporidiobolus ruineniae]
MLLLRFPSFFGPLVLASTVLASSSAHSGADFALVRRASTSSVKGVVSELTTSIEACVTKVKSLSKSITAAAQSIEAQFQANGAEVPEASVSFRGVTYAGMGVLRALGSSLQNTHNAVYNLAKVTTQVRSSSEGVNFTVSKNSPLVKQVSVALADLSTELQTTLQPYVAFSASNSTFFGLYKQAIYGTAVQFWGVSEDILSLGDTKSGTLGYYVNTAVYDEIKDVNNSFLHYTRAY